MYEGSTRSERARIIAYHDEAGELHRWDGPALIYPEGWEIWYTHGRIVYEIYPNGSIKSPYSYKEKDTK